MGIRFYCPSGHKLNVKDFQAGHKGICPHCGATVRIPVASTRTSSRSRKSRSKEAPDGTAATASDVAGGRSSALAGSPDPLDEAGDVVWYVRPASGGQFGPANADVMRSWLAEGRVTAPTRSSGAKAGATGGKPAACFRSCPRPGNFPDLEDILPSPITIPGPGRHVPVHHVSPPRHRRAIVIGSLAVAAVATLAVLLAILLIQ